MTFEQLVLALTMKTILNIDHACDEPDHYVRLNFTDGTWIEFQGTFTNKASESLIHQLEVARAIR